MNHFSLPDPFATLTDEMIARGRTFARLSHEPSPMEPWEKLFQHRLYDWGDTAWNAQNTGPCAFKVVLLTRGYFTVVSPHDYDRATKWSDNSTKKWYVSLGYNEGAIISAYVHRRGRAGEPSTVGMHRELVNANHAPGVAEHFNHWGLDNRRGTQESPVNISHVSYSENGHNALRDRPMNPGLPKGVDEVRAGSGYQGRYCKRLGKKVETIRSDVFNTPGEAAAWYDTEMARLHAERKAWAHKPASVSYPAFPPLKPGVRLGREARELLERIRDLQAKVENDVPF